MEKTASAANIKRQLSRAATSIRDGLGEYLGINEDSEVQESYYIPNSNSRTQQPQRVSTTTTSDEPYWMRQEDTPTSSPQLDGVTVIIPNNGYDESPPPYSDAPPSYSTAHLAGSAEMQTMGVTTSYYPDGAQPTDEASEDKSRGRSRGRGRGRGRGRAGRGRGGGATQRGKKVAPPPTYRPYFIIAVSVIDVILIAWEIILNHGFEPWSQNPWFGPSASVLIEAGAKYVPYMIAGEWWRFFTPIFLHVGLGHILMNMLTQLRVGVALERSYGAHRIAPIYFLCGVMGNLASAIMLPSQIQVGASGALFGFTGVLLADLLQNWAVIQNPWRNLASLIFSSMISLVLGLILPGVDNYAHIGGLIMGILTGFIFLPSLNPARSAQKGRLKTVVVCVIITIAVFIALFSVFYRRIDASQWCYGCQYITCLHALKWGKTSGT